MHKNAEIVRRGYQAFNTADMKTLTELFDESACGTHRAEASSLVTARAARRSLPNSAAMGRIREGPSGPS